MQVRKLIVVLLALAMLTSIACFAYNIINKRTFIAYYHYGQKNQQYFWRKYQECELQIYGVMFVGQILGIGMEGALIGFLLCGHWKREGMKKLQLSLFRLMGEYLAFSICFISQGVVVGYSLQGIVEVGYENGTQFGDIFIASLQGVTFIVILITLVMYFYNIQTLHQHTSKLQDVSSIDNNQESLFANYRRNENRASTSKVESGLGRNQEGLEINGYKPDLHSYASPMSRLFQNMSNHMDQLENSLSISFRNPLLEPQPQPPELPQLSQLSQGKESPKRAKVLIPRLKLQQMKKQNKQEDYLSMLDKLEISAIKPNKSPSNKKATKSILGHNLSSNNDTPQITLKINKKTYELQVA